MTPLIFLTKLKGPTNFLALNFSLNFSVPASKLKMTTHRISFRCPLLWNNILRAVGKKKKKVFQKSGLP